MDSPINVKVQVKA